MRLAKKSLFAAVLTGAMLAGVAAAPANATVISFQVRDGSSVLGAGSVDYTGAGPFNFSNVNDFSITFGSFTYNLPQIQSLYNFMNFDPSGPTFNAGTAPPQLFNLPVVLAGMSADFGTGFIVTTGSNPYVSYGAGGPGQFHLAWDNICFGDSCGGNQQQSIPEPATLAILGVGLLIAGAGSRRRKKGEQKA